MNPGSPNMITPRLVGVGAVFIDDIVLPTGQTYMARLGGGVVHAVMGAALWGEKPGIVATIGNNLPREVRARLHRSLDTQGLYELPIPQIRAWQLFEEDGTRRELYRVKETTPFILGAQPNNMPKAYTDSQGFYLLQGFEGLRAWRSTLRGYVLWEPLQQIMVAENRDNMRIVLQNYEIDLLSPNLIEAQAVYGLESPTDLVNAMLTDGARMVALRMGERGSLIANQQGEQAFIPAVQVPNLIDQTGAGNTYCGGLLWGLLSGKTPRSAAIAGAVSASFCLEQIGVIDPNAIDPAERDRRFQQLLAHK